MTVKQSIFGSRRNYNVWVANQTLEDFALRFTSKGARLWSYARVSNTALGAVSFLALEAIGATVTLYHGFTNAFIAILAVASIIFVTGLPISYYAAKYGVDIDLLTRGAGFGYLGSTITSLIYASFTFIFFAIEAAIMAIALELLFGIPLAIGYLVCAVLVIPLVTHGITFISRFQLWTQPLWLILQVLPFVFILYHEDGVLAQWSGFEGLTTASENDAPTGAFDLMAFGAASAVLFSLIAQIGEQVDYLRFLPEPANKNRTNWWWAMLSAGPGWIVIGSLKLLGGSFLVVVAINAGVAADLATDPTQMYIVAFNYVTDSPQVALVVACVFVIVAQLKINVTNAYAGSIAWSNFFSRLTHSHPGRVVWLVFNITIALLLMEIGIYRALEETLGTYSTVAVAWVGALVGDLVINKPLRLSPPGIEFKRAHLYDINPVGFGSMIAGSTLGIVAHAGLFGSHANALAPYIAFCVAFLLAPLIAWYTDGKYYLARTNNRTGQAHSSEQCVVCRHWWEHEDMSACPFYEGLICSLCCTLDSSCRDSCKPHARISTQSLEFCTRFLPARVVRLLHGRAGRFLFSMLMFNGLTAMLFVTLHGEFSFASPEISAATGAVLTQAFFALTIISGVIIWLFVLARESQKVAEEGSQRQNQRLLTEINAHKKTDQALQRAMEKADAANLAKSRYLSGISHELRTPLNTILGYAQLLESDQSIPAKRTESIKIIRRSGEYLTDLIEGLLDVSKIEAGRLDIHRNEVHLRELLDQIVQMFQLQARAKNIEFVFSCDPRLPDYVISDEKRLRQILLNLLSNAIKFTNQGRVDFTICYGGQVAVFKVQDTGEGISSDDLERIFRPFERVQRPGSASVPGTGLGLTITRLLTEIMGGNLTVKSDIGMGSCFTLKMLLTKPNELSASAVTEAPISGYHGIRKNVMVVDDDATHRALLTDILQPLGFHMFEAQDAYHCLDLLKDRNVDLYLLDVALPGMGGWELAELLRERDSQASIIMISAEANPRYPMDDGWTVHDCYLSKPLRVPTLLHNVGQVLQIKWTQDSGATHAKSESSNDPLQSLSDDEVNELIALAEIGYVNGIKEKLETLLENGENRTLRALMLELESFQMKGFIQSLEQLRK